MGRWTFLGILFLVLLLAGGAQAAPIGPIRPEAGRWQIGGEIGAGLGGDVEYAGQPSGSSAELDQYLYLARIGYSFTDNFEGYIRLGGGSARYSEELLGITVDADMASAFVGGVGLQGRFQQVLGDWDAIAHASYLWHTNRDSIDISARGGGIGVGVGDVPADVDMAQVQFGLGVEGNHLDPWSPYVALTLSNTLIQWSIAGLAVSDVETKNVAGLVLGTGYDFSDAFRGYVEGRLVDEYAVNVGMLWAF